MLDNIKVLTHSSIKFSKEKIIYFDPFKINEYYIDADIIFITHAHYDHYSLEDIKKIVKNDTKIVVPENMKETLEKNKIKFKDIIYVIPNREYEIDNIKINTVPSYNTNKEFHPKENNWVGYIITLDNIRYYIAGDTDEMNEISKVKCDVAFIPIGGIYTMNYKEGANLTNTIKPKIVIPTHYGSIVGELEDGIKFKNLIDKDIRCELMIK